MNLNPEHITVTELLRAVTINSPKGRRDQMTDRACYGISFCISGQITYIQNGQRFVSDESHAVILPQGASYRIVGDRSGLFPVINFTCAEHLCDTITLLPLRSTEPFLGLYEQIRRLFLSSASRAKQMSLFYEILHLLAAEETCPTLLPALRLIESGLSDAELSNERLAEACKISEIYLRKLFAKHLRTSPRQYILELRLRKACTLLAEGALKISSISSDCGFASPYHFCRIFRQHIGVTPTEYREKNQIQLT